MSITFICRIIDIMVPMGGILENCVATSHFAHSVPKLAFYWMNLSAFKLNRINPNLNHLARFRLGFILTYYLAFYYHSSVLVACVTCYSNNSKL